MSPPPDPGGPAGETVRWRLRVAYDGSGFHGFAATDGHPTVGGALADALGRVTRSPVALTCAGRTDTGVHALDQVVHFDLPAEASERLDPAALVRSCNRQLGPAVVVREAAVAEPGFDARRSARSRRYRYLVVNAPVADPLLARISWHVSDPLDLRAMAAAADALVGEHDFRAFCRRPPGAEPDYPLVRRVVDARWSRLYDPPRAPSGTPGPAAEGSRDGARGAAHGSGEGAPDGASTGRPVLAPVVGSLL
ncbi:MAG TPA: hypothetical protein VKW77_10130, partial [Acidimicrobiales bacterium]|nr:hypothetical protein [Acidimicrobiales bacterium]